MNLKPIKYKAPFNLIVEISEAERKRRVGVRTSFIAEVSESYNIWERSKSAKTSSTWLKTPQGKAFNWVFNTNYQDILGDAWFKAKYNNDQELTEVLSKWRREDITSRWEARRKRRNAQKKSGAKVQEMNASHVPENVLRDKVSDLNENIDKIDRDTYRTAEDRHRNANEKLKEVKEPEYERKDQKTKRNKEYWKGKPAHQVNKQVSEPTIIRKKNGKNTSSTRAEKVRQKSRKVINSAKTATDKTTKAFTHMNNFKKLDSIINNKWFKRGLTTAGIYLAGNLALGLIMRTANSLVPPQPAIPREYDRGYDLIQERLTDFGSPVKLSKAAGKSLRQYHSSIRAGTLTTVESMTRKNISLNQYRHAIGHRRY